LSNVSERYPAASSSAPAEPIAAASDGSAQPNRIAPSTRKISVASGRKDVISSQTIVRIDARRSDSGRRGARLG
jgi:hypothetical protein